MSTRGSVESGAPAVGPAPRTRLPTPAGSPASSSRRIRWIAECGVSSLGLSTKVLPAARQGRDLPRDLQQRVVPRRHQATDPDGLVDDPADHVGVAGVDHAAGLLGGDPSVVPEHRDHVGDVVLPLDEPLARVERLHPGDVVGVALEEVGQPQQQVAALAARGGSPRPVDERRVRGGDGGLGVSRPGLVHLGDEGPVGRAADLPALTGERGDPCSVDVQIRHASPRVSSVAHVATGCSERNQQTFEGWCADTRSVKGGRESVTYR